MKLCYIADAASIHIIEWLKFFVAKGHEVFLITDTDNQINDVQTYNIGDCLPKFHIPLFSATYQIFLKIKKIKQIIHKINPDLIHAHYATNYGYLAAKSNFHPLILTCHGSDILIDPDRSKLKKHFIEIALTKSNIITLPSPEMKEKVLSLGVDERKIKIIQYGIKINKFTFNTNIITPINIISTRHLTQKYKIDILINALSKINNDYMTHIIGDGNARQTLEKLSQDLKIQNKIKFHGHVSNELIVKHYKESQIYVSTSPTDGLSIALLEAFASGCFPILPDNPSNKYVKKMGFNIELYETNNSDSLASKINLVLSKLSELKVSIEKNRELVVLLFSRQTNLNTFNNIYESFK